MLLPELLSGHRANEVANRQDADPIHFVSSVILPLSNVQRVEKQSPPSEGFVVSARRLARLLPVKSIPADFPFPPLASLLVSLGDIWRFAMHSRAVRRQLVRCRCALSGLAAIRCSGRSSRSVS